MAAALIGLALPALAADDLGLNQLRGSRVVPDRLDGIVLDQPGPVAPPRALRPPLRDHDADTALSRQEFLRAYPTRPWLFRVFDLDQDGRISDAELARARPLLPDQAG